MKYAHEFRIVQYLQSLDNIQEKETDTRKHKINEQNQGNWPNHLPKTLPF
jgi:hypothetical protein